MYICVKNDKINEIYEKKVPEWVCIQVKIKKKFVQFVLFVYFVLFL